MPTRLFRTVRSMLCGSLLAGLASAAIATPPLPPAGTYTVLATPERYSTGGSVEVVELFSYGCVHCAESAAEVDRARRLWPSQVAFKLVPAMFNMPWLVYARGFYVARQFHAVEASHLALFKAKWVDHRPLEQLPQLAQFYAGYGIDPAQFVDLAQSRPVWEQMRHDALLAERWGVDSTPAFIVDGRYRVSADGNHSYAGMLAVVDALVRHDLEQVTPATPK
ncbi:thiol:disulfide interchange protein DsbA/DsbL [Frateuria aurantia]